ncbi:unnamed protein product [Rotaria sp. Silwood1]|nr:unnamed protein product [Rotaria sp. Silwood1]CAF1440789.1 unnamed protein product [Rotaria sp. Silwood1]CAF3555461.1 unnamed protein product [Rotaria sp. Silwood1]CAF3581109.1 unnamed protein product [Rotaria sp. Silwood1]CAF3591724.1 unnamed protein product [Rotaria sp. Silwood1]
MMQPLALAANLSTSLSLSLFYTNENEIHIQFIIYRDPNLVISPMTLLYSTPHYQLFNISSNRFHLTALGNASLEYNIDVIVEIFSFLRSILLIQFFRRIKPRRSHQQLSPLREAVYKIKPQSIP